MADPNNKKDIQDSKAELDNFNDALRDSISLSRVLSDNIQSFAKKLGGVNVEDRKLIDNTKLLNKTLTSTLSLTDKLNAGKLKQADIDKQLTTLTNLQNKYFAEALDKNSRINQAIQLQDKLQKEITGAERTQTDLLGQAEGLYAKRNEQLKISQESLEREEAARRRGQHNLINVEKQIQKAAKEQITNLNYQVAEQERIVTNNEKLLTQKKKEKDETDRIVNSFIELIALIQEHILKSQALSEELEKQKSTSEEIKDEFEKIGDRIKNSIKSVFSLTTVFEYLKKAAFSTSEQVTKLQKGLVLSREEAYDVRQQFNNIAIASEDAAINTNRLVEANSQLGKQLGFNSKFTPDLNIQFIKLTKQIGLSEEAAGGLAKLSIATGKTLEESKNTALGVSQALSAQYGIQLDQREVLEEVGKISGQTLAMFKGSVPALAQAVAQAKLLGTNLDNAKKQASSLLNFETSIENELQAELLTGQQLNLERARTAALTGDLTTVMKELNNQNIDFNKFSNMNVIAQDKIAAALGLSSDELSDQLLKQQYMGKSTKEVAALAGDEVAKRLEALNAQDKFNLAMEKMQDLVGSIIGGGLGTLVDMMASLANNSTLLFTTLGLIAGISFTKLIVGLAASAVQAGLLAAGTAATASAITLGVGAVAIVAGIAAMAAAYKNAKEEAAAPELADGGLAYGKTNAIVGEYAGAANNPEVIAPLSDLQNIIDNSNRQNAAAQDNSEMIRLFTDMRNELRATRENTGKFVDKKLVASIEKGFVQGFGTEQMKGQTLFA